MEKKIVGVVDPTKLKQTFCVFWKLIESTRMRMGNSVPHYHQDHIAGKGENSLHHYNVVHKFISYASSYENLCSKSSGGQGMGKIGENFGVEPDESQK